MSVPDLNRALDFMADSLMMLKRERCIDRGGPTDLAPMLYVIFDDGSHDVDVLLADREAIPELLRRIWLDRLGEAQFVYIGFLMDAYHRQVEVPREGADDQLAYYLNTRGLATAAFHAGDMSVTEMLVVLLLHVQTNRLHEVQMPYTYRDDGTPRFGKRRRHDEPDTMNLGALGALLREGAGVPMDDSTAPMNEQGIENWNLIAEEGWAPPSMPDHVADAARRAFQQEDNK